MSKNAVALIVLGVLVLSTRDAMSAVKSASSDGEATAYLLGPFSSEFDIAYRAVLKPGAHNKSWSTLSMLLVGSRIPGPGASVGLASTPPHQRSARPFSYVNYPDLKDDYEDRSVNCDRGCTIELRADARTVYAYVQRRMLASWSRSDLYLQHPSIQLNAEVHEAGDSVYASLTPIRAIVAGRAIRQPTCAFTTRGIEPFKGTALVFRGTTNNAAAAYVDLATGVRADKC